MKKDKTIIDFIDRLKSRINFHLLQIVDYWDADLCAIGLKKGDKLVYISTYNSVPQNIIKYDYDLEVLDVLDESSSAIFEKGRSVTENELVEKLRTFLEV